MSACASITVSPPNTPRVSPLSCTVAPHGILLAHPYIINLTHLAASTLRQRCPAIQRACFVAIAASRPDDASIAREMIGKLTAGHVVPNLVALVGGRRSWGSLAEAAPARCAGQPGPAGARGGHVVGRRLRRLAEVAVSCLPATGGCRRQAGHTRPCTCLLSHYRMHGRYSRGPAMHHDNLLLQSTWRRRPRCTLVTATMQRMPQDCISLASERSWNCSSLAE